MSVVMSSSRLFPEENGYTPHYVTDNSTVRSCSCCPYGYHIDLDFVRYIESLANAYPSEKELQRRHNRRSRKSMEFMLGVENLSLDQWDTPRVPELHQENVLFTPPTAATAAATAQTPPSTPVTSSTTYAGFSSFSARPRSASVPRFTYHTNTTRPDSPFGTASSTCSSLLGAESDVPFSLYQRRQRRNQQHPTETHAFLRDALDDVCSDFERTLERTSGRRKKSNSHVIDVDGHRETSVFGDCNNNQNKNFWKKQITTENEKRTYSTWERKYDFLDSCISGNKSPRSSSIFYRSNTLPYIQKKPTEAEEKYELYVKANVAANATTPVDKQLRHVVPPPPPPRRHTLNRTRSPMSQTSETDAIQKPVTHSTPTAIVKESTVVETAITPDPQTLYNIRQQMAVSLSRMRELEEQVKTIPALQLELQNLREEKRRLELSRPIRASETPSPLTSPKFPYGAQFAPQHITSVSLESLGARLRTSSSSSSERRVKTVLKRDVGINCTQTKKRDMAVGSPTISMRSVSTDPEQKLHIDERLFTQNEIEENVKCALQKHREQRLQNMATKSTQMLKQWDGFCNTGTQTNAVNSQKNTAVMCKPETRSIGSSEHCISDILCEKCLVKKLNVACGTDDDEQRKSWVSLKTLDMPYTRSNTFSLGEQERLNLVIRKSIGTQCNNLAELVDVYCQTFTTPTLSVGVQNSPNQMQIGTQTFVEFCDQETDTKGLISLRISETNTEEVAAPIKSKEIVEPVKPRVLHQGSNTERIYTRDRGENTESLYNTRHMASNTEEISKRDIACGDIVKPHISIACAENYCDSCKDTIKNLAKDFSKGQPVPLSPIPQRASESRIPRPKHLSSPSPVRKSISRQNTYTVALSPTRSPGIEKQSGPSSLPTSFYRENSLGDIKPTKSDTSSKKLFNKKAAISNSNDSMSKHKSSHFKRDMLNEPLIVREEKRVSICWSREASPLPTPTDSTGSKSLQTSLHEHLQVEPTLDKNTIKKTSQKNHLESANVAKNAETTAATSTKTPTITETKYVLPTEVSTAMKTLNESLLKKMGAKPLSSTSLKVVKATIQLEWFRVSSTEEANPFEIQTYLNNAEKMSLQLLEYCVNMRDNNGNTSLHYAVSHGNFDIVSILLDSKVCDVNQMNNAGYTSVMLVSLAKLKNTSHRGVVERLFRMADINIRAKKHCQTALMLAVSHGNLDMVEMLLAAGADINVQDEDGSTALMCAAEHGRVDIVKHLLSHSECDSLIQDIDGSTAFKIAWQGGYRDVGLLLYVHEQMLRSKMPQRAETQRTNTSLQSPHTDKKSFP